MKTTTKAGKSPNFSRKEQESEEATRAIYFSLKTLTMTY